MKPKRLVLTILAVAAGVLGALGGSGLASAATNGSVLGPNSNLGFLFAIYLITWAGFFGYSFIVSRRQRSLEREIDALRALLQEQDSSQKG